MIDLKNGRFILMRNFLLLFSIFFIQNAKTNSTSDPSVHSKDPTNTEPPPGVPKEVEPRMVGQIPPIQLPPKKEEPKKEPQKDPKKDPKKDKKPCKFPLTRAGNCPVAITHPPRNRGGGSGSWGSFGSWSFPIMGNQSGFIGVDKPNLNSTSLSISTFDNGLSNDSFSTINGTGSGFSGGTQIGGGSGSTDTIRNGIINNLGGGIKGVSNEASDLSNLDSSSKTKSVNEDQETTIKTVRGKREWIVQKVED